TGGIGEVAVGVANGVEGAVEVETRSSRRTGWRTRDIIESTAVRNDVTRVVHGRCVDVVEEVVSLRDKFGVKALSEGEFLRYAHVDDLRARHPEGVSTDRVDTAAATGAIDARGKAAGGTAGSHKGKGEAALRLVERRELPTINEVTECALFPPGRPDNGGKDRALANVEVGVAILPANIERVE